VRRTTQVEPIDIREVPEVPMDPVKPADPREWVTRRLVSVAANTYEVPAVIGLSPRCCDSRTRRSQECSGESQSVPTQMTPLESSSTARTTFVLIPAVSDEAA
jgi:hypothetical protein